MKILINLNGIIIPDDNLWQEICSEFTWHEVALGSKNIKHLIQEKLHCNGKTALEYMEGLWQEYFRFDETILLAIQHLRDQGHAVYFACYLDHYSASYVYSDLELCNYCNGFLASSHIGYSPIHKSFYSFIGDKFAVMTLVSNNYLALAAAQSCGWSTVEYKSIADLYFVDNQIFKGALNV